MSVTRICALCCLGLMFTVINSGCTTSSMSSINEDETPISTPRTVDITEIGPLDGFITFMTNPYPGEGTFSLEFHSMSANGTEKTTLGLIGLSVSASWSNNDLISLATLPSVWSPDGSRIAFMPHNQSDRGISVADAVSGQTSFLADGLKPTWSPDGQRIAFLRSLEGGNYDIYAVNADGSGETRLSQSGGNKQQVVWSPDGQQFTFSVCVPSQPRCEEEDIFVMNADGSGETRLATNVPRAWALAWSPDSQRIGFLTCIMQLGVDCADLVVMNADGSDQTTIATAVHRFAWSPDGSRILFDRQQDGDRAIFVINSDGSGEARIASDEVSPDWSPDGRHIVFTATDRAENGIFVMQADGSKQMRLFTEGMMPDWSPQ